MDAQAKRRWLVLAVAAFVVSGLEVVSAVLVYGLMSLIGPEAQQPDLPVVGRLREAFPGLSADERLLAFVAAVGGFFVVRAGAMLAQIYLQARFVQGEGVKLSSRLLRGYTRLPYVVHLRRDSAELIRNTMGSVNDVVTHAFAPAIAIAADALMVAALLAVLLVVSWEATLASFGVIVAVVLLILRAVHPRLAHVGDVAQRVYRETIKAVQHIFDGLREIRVLGKEAYFTASFERSWGDYARAQYRRATLVELPRIALETVLLLGILGFLGITVAVQGTPTEALAVLGLFGYATLRIIPAVNRLVANVNAVKYGTAAVEIVAREMEFVPPEADPSAMEAGNDGGTFSHEISLEDIWYRYGPQEPWVIRGVEVSIRKGESIGIVGSTGGGKSTIADLILGLLEPERGRVAVDGLDVRADLAAWHRQLGVVPQSIFLVDDTIAKNIALGVDLESIDPERLSEVADVAQLTDFVRDLAGGFETVVGDRGIRLSGGQRQRIAIARALYRDPAVLVFDEGTSALDNATEASLLRAVEDSKEDKTVVTIAHRLTTVRNCDRILVIDDGRVEASGSYDYLVRESRIFRDLTR